LQNKEYRVISLKNVQPKEKSVMAIKASIVLLFLYGKGIDTSVARGHMRKRKGRITLSRLATILGTKELAEEFKGDLKYLRRFKELWGDDPDLVLG